jgi:hypothetical protein
MPAEIGHHLGSDRNNLIEAPSVRGMAQLLRRREEHIYALRTVFNRQPGIIHMAADVGQHPCPQSTGSDPFEITGALGRGSRRRQFDILNTEGIKCFGHSDTLFAGEGGTGKLLTFTQGGIDQVKPIRHGHCSGSPRAQGTHQTTQADSIAALPQRDPAPPADTASLT